MDITCLLEERSYTDRSGISEFRVVEEGTGKRFTARGYLHDAKIGSMLLLKGVSGPDPNGNISYGSAHTVTATEEEAAVVLSCADGISAKIARLIIETLGTDVFGYMDTPGLAARLMKIPGIGPSKASAVVDLLGKQASSNEDFAWLMQQGFSYLGAMRAIREHGPGTKKYILSDPYGPMYRGQAPFEVCERIAQEAGMDAWAVERVRAVERAVLDANAAEGNTRMPMQDFLRRCSTLSVWDGGTAIPDEVLSVAAYDLGRCFFGEDGEEYASLKKYRRAEEAIVSGLRRLKASAHGLGEPTDADIAWIEQETGTTYNAQQRAVFQLFAHGGVAVLTGYPGTGKTTVINGLIRFYTRMRPDSAILLCAPTGRAASRAGEASGRDGLTMHKAMKKTPFGGPAVSATELDYGFIVVDEMSMCDTQLFASFLDAVKSGTTVLLAGDPDQLPSVGAGQVFRDLAESGAVPVYRLTELVRQEEGSGIVRNARAALAGEEIREYPDFQILRCNMDSDTAAELVVREAEAFPSMPLILSPIKEGPGGVYELNRVMQDRFAKPGKPVWINGTRFYAGDPVIMTHNNYKYGYFNGEAGTLVRADCGKLIITLPGRTVSLDIADASEVALAYALTVHRSQGTESDYCIIVLPEEARHMASRELLNTAFTRAKKAAVAIVPGRTSAGFRAGARQARRECGLAEMLSALA